jgi:serine/threonine protein kinase
MALIPTGSSLLEVFEDSPRRRIAGTSGWGAPESHLRLDSLGLRRVDVYSFGLLAWRVMLNGVKPWERLAKADGDVWALGPGESQDSVTMLTSTVFDSLKGTGPTDRIPDLAKNTFTGCYRGDVDFDTVCKIFHRTLQKEPDLRVQDFRDVISLLQNNRDLIKSV